jgi:DnaA family protein
MLLAGVSGPGVTRTARSTRHTDAMAQIPLPLVLRKYSRFDTFVAGDNSALVGHLASLGPGSEPAILWIWGPMGSGKSHLLQATCASSAAQRAMYLPLRPLPAAGVDVLQGLEALDILALDDVDVVSGDALWEQALFGLYNRVQMARTHLIFSAHRAPKAAPFTLPDLASRAAGAVVYQLRTLNDDQSLVALREHANARGLDLPEAAARYLFARVSRASRTANSTTLSATGTERTSCCNSRSRAPSTTCAGSAPIAPVVRWMICSSSSQSG